MAQLLDRKHVTVKELAASKEVSGATVRRDQRALADEDELLLVHGGATIPRQRDFSFQSRQILKQKMISATSACVSSMAAPVGVTTPARRSHAHSNNDT